VISLDRSGPTVALDSGKQLTCERLVLANGSVPLLPPIPGIEKRNVFSIKKSLSAMVTLRERARDAKNVVVLGGGFIGAEFTDELARKPGVRVQLVEMQPKLLMGAFDDEFCDEISGLLVEAGVEIHTGVRAISLAGESEVEEVVLDTGERLPADLVILGVGGKPDSALAKAAGLRVTDGGSIWVDSYMRTTDAHIFAVGDCALKRDFFTRKEAPVWLASTATAEARTAGTNLYGIRVLRKIQGTVSAFSTAIGGRSFASVGMTRKACEAEDFRIVVGEAVAPDRHPGTLPGARPLKMKLIFANRGGTLLGGQLSGGPSVGELVNSVAIAIQLGLSVRSLETMQIATHPLLSPAPTVHPLVKAAAHALAQFRAADAGG
jgi:NADPH-dependent 2,4-dienoyl-CoA reductase/sulfur reductase-like enzyme